MIMGGRFTSLIFNGQKIRRDLERNDDLPGRFFWDIYFSVELELFFFPVENAVFHPVFHR